jgi:hypothetical protein
MPMMQSENSSADLDASRRDRHGAEELEAVAIPLERRPLGFGNPRVDLREELLDASVLNDGGGSS